MRVRPRVIFDTNTLISAALFAGSTPAKALLKALEQCELIASDTTFAEFVDALSRKKFDAYVSRHSRSAFVAQLQANMWRVTVTPQLTLCRDLNDNKFLDLAVQGSAQYVITGDEDLLALHPVQGIGIINAKMFLMLHGFPPARE